MYSATTYFRFLFHRHKIEGFRQFEGGDPVTSDDLDRFLPDTWLRSNRSHRWELGEVRLKEREFCRTAEASEAAQSPKTPINSTAVGRTLTDEVNEKFAAM